MELKNRGRLTKCFEIQKMHLIRPHVNSVVGLKMAIFNKRS